MEKLITDYRYELEEDHHSFGSGRYGVVVKVTNDIGPAMPYLNAVLTETRYDHENQILIGARGNKRYAFRPHEIRAPMVPDPKDAPVVAEEAVEMVNRVAASGSGFASSVCAVSMACLPPTLRSRLSC